MQFLRLNNQGKPYETFTYPLSGYVQCSLKSSGLYSAFDSALASTNAKLEFGKHYGDNFPELSLCANCAYACVWSVSGKKCGGFMLRAVCKKHAAFILLGSFVDADALRNVSDLQRRPSRIRLMT